MYLAKKGIFHPSMDGGFDLIIPSLTSLKPVLFQDGIKYPNLSVWPTGMLSYFRMDAVLI